MRKLAKKGVQLALTNEQLEINRISLEKAHLQIEKYKATLARPLQSILDENAQLKKAYEEQIQQYKKAYEEQQQITVLWLLRQRAMKKVALDLGKKLDISDQEILNQSVENAFKIIKNGDTLEGIVGEKEFQRFENHKSYLLGSIK